MNAVHLQVEAGWGWCWLEKTLAGDAVSCGWRWFGTALVGNGAALGDVNEVHLEIEAGWRCRELQTVTGTNDLTRSAAQQPVFRSAFNRQFCAWAL
jgi:hypothetical protein